jgi:TrmH family RNA methyltransferase
MNISANKSISSLMNPELKFLISLSKNKIRKSENKSLAEGYRENKSLISSDYEIDTLYICEELFVGNNNYTLINSFNKKGIRIVTLTKKVFQAISYRDRPDGILSLFIQKNLTSSDDVLNGPVLIADQIEKPGNLGTMIRTAKSLGVENVFCSDEITDFYNPNVIRASIGHMFTMNLISDTTSNIIDLLNINSYQIILMDPDSEYLLKDFKAKENFALVIGSEQYGISDKWLNTDCVKLKIESLNDVDSINASTAAAISMWELLR